MVAIIDESNLIAIWKYIKNNYLFGKLIFSDELYKEAFSDKDKITKKSFMNCLSELCKSNISVKDGIKIKKLYRLGKGVYYSSYKNINSYSVLDNNIRIINFFTDDERGVCVGDILLPIIFNVSVKFHNIKIYSNNLSRNTMILKENLHPGPPKINSIEIQCVNMQFSTHKIPIVSLLYILENSESLINNYLNNDLDYFYSKLINYVMSNGFPFNEVKLYEELEEIFSKIKFKKRTLAHLQDFINYAYLKNKFPFFKVNFRKAGLLNKRTTYYYFSKDYLKKNKSSQ